MQLLKKTPNILVGIDIGARYIKLIALSHHKQNTPVITHYAIAELPMTVLNDSNEIKDSATISNTLIQAREHAQLLLSRAVIALPGSSVVTKQIIIDGNYNDNELEAQAWLEAGKHFPELIEDLSLDFYVTGPAPDNNKAKEILLVACRKTSIQNRLNVLADSHFEVDVVDVDYYALERNLHYMISQQEDLNPEDSYALLDLGTRSSTLVAIQNNKLVYAHDQIFDGQRLMQRLQQECQWPNLLLHPAKIPATIEANATATINEILATHVNYVLELFYSSKQEISIHKLFLSGECAIIPQVAEIVAEKVGIPTFVANPIINMSIASSIDETSIKAIAPSLALCCGLALHEGAI